jgi:hypothetical protein
MWIYLAHPNTWTPLRVLRECWTQTLYLEGLRWPASLPGGILWQAKSSFVLKAHLGVTWLYKDALKRNKWANSTGFPMNLWCSEDFLHVYWNVPLRPLLHCPFKEGWWFFLMNDTHPCMYSKFYTSCLLLLLLFSNVNLKKIKIIFLSLPLHSLLQKEGEKWLHILLSSCEKFFPEILFS